MAEASRERREGRAPVSTQTPEPKIDMNTIIDWTTGEIVTYLQECLQVRN